MYEGIILSTQISTISTEQVELHKHKPEWKTHFKLLSNILLKDCTKVIKNIEHIGSTTIEGIKAKNIIDIQCGVIKLEHVSRIKTTLNALGFTEIENIHHDHVPFHDIEYFDAQWAKKFFTGKYRGIAYNLHIRVIGNENWKFAINFRDFLQKNKNVAIAYEQIKSRLQRAGVSRDMYCFIKDPVCDLIYLLFKNTNN